MFLFLLSALAAAPLDHDALTLELLQGIVAADRVNITYRFTSTAWNRVATLQAQSGTVPSLLWRMGDERVRTALDGRTAVVTIPVAQMPAPETTVTLVVGDHPFTTLRYLTAEDKTLFVPYGPPTDIILRPGPTTPAGQDVLEVVDGVNQLAAAQRARKDAKDSLDPNDPTVKACEKLARNYARVKCVEFAARRPQGAAEVQGCARMPIPEKGQCYDWLRDTTTPAGRAVNACVDTFGGKAALGCAKRMPKSVRPRGDELMAVCTEAFSSTGDQKACAKTLTHIPDAEAQMRCASESKAKKRLACLGE